MAGAGAANSRYVPLPKWTTLACFCLRRRETRRNSQLARAGALGYRRGCRRRRRRRALVRECEVREVHEVVLSQEGKAEMDEMGDAAMVNGWTLLHS